MSLRNCVRGVTDKVEAAPTRREDISALHTYHSLFSTDTRRSVWYTEYNNRGYIAPRTLKLLGDQPFVEERWKVLSEELNKFRQPGKGLRKDRKL